MNVLQNGNGMLAAFAVAFVIVSPLSSLLHLTLLLSRLFLFRQLQPQASISVEYNNERAGRDRWQRGTGRGNRQT